MSAAAVSRVLRLKRLFVRTYKSQRGCAHCGESDWRVLQLDHLDPSLKMVGFRKTQGRPKASWQNLSWARLSEELAKCQVLCANCHMRKTADEQGWEQP